MFWGGSCFRLINHHNPQELRTWNTVMIPQIQWFIISFQEKKKRMFPFQDKPKVSCCWKISQKISHCFLVGGWPTPLKNLSQLGLWHAQYEWKNKTHVPNHQPVLYCFGVSPILIIFISFGAASVLKATNFNPSAGRPGRCPRSRSSAQHEELVRCDLAIEIGRGMDGTPFSGKTEPRNSAENGRFIGFSMVFPVKYGGVGPENCQSSHLKPLRESFRESAH